MEASEVVAVDNLTVNNGLTGSDSSNRVRELCGSGNAILEEVAHSARAVAQKHDDVGGLQDWERTRIPMSGWVRSDLERGPDPVVGVGRRHADVGDDDIRWVVVRQLGREYRRPLGRPPATVLIGSDRPVRDGAVYRDELLDPNW